jgi:hypothetical protein
MTSGNTTVTLVVPNLSDDMALKLYEWLERSLNFAFLSMEHSLLVTRGQTPISDSVETLARFYIDKN